MGVRVVFADDQIPSEDAEQNKRARDVIVSELKPTRENVEADYEQDDRWFRGLISYLQDREGFKIIPAKTISQAEIQLQKRKDYDVAVVDMSWFGDPDVKSGSKRDAGLELLRLVDNANRESSDRKSVIAFSQNFEKDFELVGKVRELGALPIQKNYGESGHRILGAAIRLLSDPVQGPLLDRRPSEMTVKQVLRLFGNLRPGQLWSLLSALGAIFAGVFYLGYKLGPLFWK